LALHDGVTISSRGSQWGKLLPIATGRGQISQQYSADEGDNAEDQEKSQDAAKPEAASTATAPPEERQEKGEVAESGTWHRRTVA
jgi:hypothetical protein